MEFAVEVFCDSDGAEVQRLRKLLDHEQIRDIDWHLKDVCRRLIERPLRVNSKEHAPFWCALDNELSLAQGRHSKLACVVIDKRETMLVSHYDLLVALVGVLSDASLYAKLKSLRALPLFLVQLLISKPGLRRFMFASLSDACREEINVDDLRRKSELGFEIYINTIDDLMAARGFAANDTPTPLVEARYERPSKRTKQPDEWYEPQRFLELFPVRGACSDVAVVPFSAQLIAVLLSAHSMLHTDLARLRSSSSDVNWDASAGKLADMRSAFPVMLSLLGEELDQQTLGRLRPYFAGHQGVLETLQSSAQRLRAHLTNGDLSDPRFAEGISLYARRAERMFHRHKSHFQDTTRRASFYNPRECALHEVSAVPVAHLLRQLDAANMFAGATLRLREFLHEQDRLEYFAYRFPRGVSLFEVSASLAALAGWWQLPMLSESCWRVVLTPKGRAALVTTPSIMLGLRMVSITRAYIAGLVQPASYWRFCLRNLVHLPPSTCPQLHDVAVFCMAAAVGCRLDEGHVLTQLAPPGHPHFPAYRLLPALCTALDSEHPELLVRTVRLLIPRQRKISVALQHVHRTHDYLEAEPELDEDGLAERLLLRMDRPARFKAEGHRIVLTKCRPWREQKNPLYVGELLNAFLASVHTTPRHIANLLSDLLAGVELGPQKPQARAPYTSANTSRLCVERYAELEARVRREEEAMGAGSVGLDRGQLSQAYEYYVARGYFVPSLRHLAEIDTYSPSPDHASTLHDVETAPVPPKHCTADNISEHIDHYRKPEFIQFLYHCLVDAESWPEPNLGDILAVEEPPLLELCLCDGTSAPIEFSFLLSRAGVPVGEKRSVPEPNSSGIDDRYAQDLVTQYADGLVLSDRVTKRMDYAKSYLECVQHLHELMEI